MKRFLTAITLAVALVGAALAAGDLTGDWFYAHPDTQTIGLGSSASLKVSSTTDGRGAFDTGLVRSAAATLRITDGASTSGALHAATAGPATTQQHTLPAVTSDTFTLNGATQTLTGKTLTSPTISAPTISGAASLTGTLTPASTGRILSTNGVEFFDDFTNEVLDTNRWTVNSDAGGTPFAIAIAANGTIAGAADNEAADKEELASEIIYTTSAVTYFETRVKVDDITTVAFNIGLSDAKNEAATTIAWTVGGSDTVTTNSDDGVGFVYDTRADTDGLFGVVSATTDDKEGAGAIAPVNGTWIKLAFAIDASRLVTFYVNGTAYGSASTALDATTLLCPYVAEQSTTTATRTLTVDYVYIWQQR